MGGARRAVRIRSLVCRGWRGGELIVSAGASYLFFDSRLSHFQSMTPLSNTLRPTSTGHRLTTPPARSSSTNHTLMASATTSGTLLVFIWGRGGMVGFMRGESRLLLISCAPAPCLAGRRFCTGRGCRRLCRRVKRCVWRVVGGPSALRNCATRRCSSSAESCHRRWLT